MTIKYGEALAMAQELGEKAYAREFVEGEKGAEALRKAGYTPLTAGLTRMAESYGLKKDPGVPVTFSHWVNVILENRKNDGTAIEAEITEAGATVRLNPEYNRNSEQLTSVEMTEDGQTELEAIAKIGLRVLLKQAAKVEQAKLVIA
jgi:hypothetical protein